MTYRISIEAARADLAAQIKAQRDRELGETAEKTAKLRAQRLAREAARSRPTGQEVGA